MEDTQAEGLIGKKFTDKRRNNYGGQELQQ